MVLRHLKWKMIRVILAVTNLTQGQNNLRCWSYEMPWLQIVKSFEAFYDHGKDKWWLDSDASIIEGSPSATRVNIL